MTGSPETMIHLKTWAVVGASNAHGKFGRRIFDTLKARGYEVYAVNPNEPDGLDDGSPTYPTLRELPVVPDVVDVVVPPRLGAAIVADCVAQGIRNIWFQPGAESSEAVGLAEASGLNVVWGGPCAMAMAKEW